MAKMNATPDFVLELNKFGDEVIKLVYKELAKRGYEYRIVTGKLYRSVRFTVNKRLKRISFYYKDYGQYLDESPKYHSRVRGSKGMKTMGWFSDPYNKAIKKFPSIIEEVLVKEFEKALDDI